MEKKIEEGNKLIAEFMGATFTSEDAYGNGKIVNYVNYSNHPNQLIKNTGRKFIEVDLIYHSSFDWLMPVVEKYAEIEHGEGWGNSFGYAEIFTELRKKYNTYHDGMVSTIKEVHISLVEFINQYNTNTSTIK